MASNWSAMRKHFRTCGRVMPPPFRRCNSGGGHGARFFAVVKGIGKDEFDEGAGAGPGFHLRNAADLPAEHIQKAIADSMNSFRLRKPDAVVFDAEAQIAPARWLQADLYRSSFP